LKAYFSMPIALLVVCGGAFLAGQDEAKPPRHTSLIESRQGHYPSGPDVIGHAPVLKGDTVRCVLVGVYDETHSSSTSCVLKLANHGEYTLAQGQSMQSPEQGELFLECSGDKPRRCIAQLN